MRNCECETTGDFISDLRYLVCNYSSDDRTFPPRERLNVMLDMIVNKTASLREKVEFLNEEVYSTIIKNTQLVTEQIYNSYIDWDRRHICAQLRKCNRIDALHQNVLKHIENNGINLVYTGEETVDSFVVNFAVLSYLYYDAIDFITDDLYYLIDDNKVSKRYKYDYLMGAKPVSKAPLGKAVYVGDLGDVLNKYESFYLEGKELKEEDTFNLSYYKVYSALMELNIANSLSKKEFNVNTTEYVRGLEDLILRALYTPIEIPNDVVLGLEDFKSNLEQELNEHECVKQYFKSKPKLLGHYSNHIETIVKTYNSRIMFINVIKPNTDLLKIGFANFPNMKQHLVILSHLSKIINFGINTLMKELYDLLDSILYDVVDIIKKVYTEKCKSQSVEIENKVETHITKMLNLYSSRELNSLAKSKGFEKHRQKGDHGIFKRLDGTVVVIPQGRCVGKGLSCKIQKTIQNE